MAARRPVELHAPALLFELLLAITVRLGAADLELHADFVNSLQEEVVSRLDETCSICARDLLTKIDCLFCVYQDTCSCLLLYMAERCKSKAYPFQSPLRGQ